MKPGKRICATLACAALGLGTVAAAATGDPIAASATCCTYTASSFDISAGTLASFNNDGTDATHDVAAVKKGPDGQPLFKAGQIRSGTTPVAGTQYLAPGDYKFFCTIHGADVMSATLTILPGATPQARPAVDVTIPAQSLAKTVSSGKLAVTVKGKVAASGVRLTVKKGTRRLGTVSKLNLAAGASRTVRVPLSKSAKKLLYGLTSATLAAEAAVPFGKTDRSTRKLR